MVYVIQVLHRLPSAALRHPTLKQQTTNKVKVKFALEQVTKAQRVVEVSYIIFHKKIIIQLVRKLAADVAPTDSQH
jgi:hypothetical protein